MSLIERLDSRRLLASGVADLSYGEKGFVPGGDNVWQIIGRRKDGTVLFGVDYGGGQQVEAIKPNGTFDEAGFHGPNLYNFVSSDFALDSKDRLMYLGLPRYDESTGDQLPTVQRYTATGELDPSYTPTVLPRPGRYHGIRSQYYSASNITVDTQGRSLLLSISEYGKPGDPFTTIYSRAYIERLRPNGGRDPDFGDNGRLLVATYPGRIPSGIGFAVQSDGKVLFLRSPEDMAATLTRYTSSGTLDSSFGDDGVLTLPDNAALRSAQLTLDRQGRAVVASNRSNKPNRLVVRRFDDRGRLDTTFGEDGTTFLADKDLSGEVTAIRPDRDGRLIVGMGDGLIRLGANGLVDTTFGQNGIVHTGQPYLYYTLPTPEGIYAASKIGSEYGVGRFIDTGTNRLDSTTGRLIITGTTEADLIRVRQKGTTIGRVGVTLGDGTEQVFTGVKSIQIDALSGRDRVGSNVTLPTNVNLGTDGDQFVGSNTAFTVFGGAGDDSILTDRYTDQIDAGDGEDTIQSNDGDDIIEAGAGNDTVYAANGRDKLTNASGADYTDLGPGGGTFVYGNRNRFDDAPQTVVGRGGTHSRYNVVTGQGSDMIGISGGEIVVDAGGTAGNRVTALAAVRATVIAAGLMNTIVTGDGNDLIQLFGDGRARISGGAGDDTIVSSIGRDTLNGGPGNDLISDAGGNNRIYGGDGNDSIRSGDGDDILYGEADQDTIRGNGGTDWIDGGSEGDLLFGGSRRDTLIGGPGRDRGHGDEDDLFESIETIAT